MKFLPGDRVAARASGYGKNAGKIHEGTVLKFHKGKTRNFVIIQWDDEKAPDWGFVDLYQHFGLKRIKRRGLKRTRPSFRRRK